MDQPSADTSPKLFFGPHPGMLGATVPLPNLVLRAANDLNGRILPVARALELLQRAFPRGSFKVIEGLVRPGEGVIMLTLGPAGGPRHIWRIIHFRKP